VIRLSVSDLESFRYWKANEDSTLEELVARLTKKEPPTPQMEAGAALAFLFEGASPMTIDSWSTNGWTFRFALDGERHRFALPPVRELKAEVIFETPSGPVTLVGKVDGIDGMTVFDQKLTESFDAERYLDSLQWRSYLVMFGAKEFVYDVFVGKYDRDPGRTDEDGTYKKGPIRLAPNGLVTITDYHRLPFYAYPEIRADVERAVRELAEVVVTYGIPKTMVAPAAEEGATNP
jgi:hypothetical protein